MAFLPQNYEKPATGSNYLKLQKGDNKIRILGSAIVGWVDWSPDKKPVRTHERPETSFDPKKPAKHFWAFPIWDYKDKAVKIYEVTQTTIREALYALTQDENWGDVTAFDITIKKSGEDLDTTYSVVPVPPKPLHPEIARLYGEAKINLNALFEGKDPFAGNESNIPAMTEPDNGEIRIEDVPF